MTIRLRRLPRATILRAAICSLVLVSWSCSSDSPTEPTVNVPYSQTDLVVGTGTEAINGSRVTVGYSGWFYSTSAPENKGAPFETGTIPFTVGLGQVIKGWDQGIPGMRVGGQRRLVIPPSLAYGSDRYGTIPGNSTLVFDVTLLGVQ